MRERIRVRFGKGGGIRYISHLELMRVFERAVRRAELPVKMTEGFNPRPRISFPIPLGVGMEGMDEVAEIELSDWIPPGEAKERLASQMPEGIELLSVEPIPPGKKGSVSEVEYAFVPTQDAGVASLVDPKRVEALLARSEVTICRERNGKTKQIDIRPYIKDIRLDGVVVILRLKATPQGTARPEEVLAELGAHSALRDGRGRLVRTRVVLAANR